MFELLAQVVRLRRTKAGLSQDELAKLAGVSRGLIVALENGENVTLRLLVKVARALNVKELPLGDLDLRVVPPDVLTVVHASHGVAEVRNALHAAVAGADEKLDAVTAKLDALLDRAMAGAGASDDRGVERSAKRLENASEAERASVEATLREMTAARPPRARSPRPKAASGSSAKAGRRGR